MVGVVVREWAMTVISLRILFRFRKMGCHCNQVTICGMQLQVDGVLSSTWKSERGIHGLALDNWLFLYRIVRISDNSAYEKLLYFSLKLLSALSNYS